MSVRIFPGTGAYRAGENCILHNPIRNDVRYGAIVAHGATGDWTAMATDPFVKALCNNLNLSLLTADFGGASPWFNATHRDGIQSGVDYLTSQPNVRNDKVILIGASMGFAGVLRWARENPAKVLCIIGIVGVADADAMYSSNRAGLAAAMDAAWGSNYLVNGSPFAPMAAGNPAMVAGIPILLTYSTGDTIVLASEVQALAAAFGNNATLYAIPGAPAHGSASALLPPAKLLEFIGGVL